MARKHVLKHDKSTIINWQRAGHEYLTYCANFKICLHWLCFSFIIPCVCYHNYTVTLLIKPAELIKDNKEIVYRFEAISKQRTHKEATLNSCVSIDD